MTEEPLLVLLIVLGGSFALGEAAAVLRQPRIVGAMVWGIALATFNYAAPSEVLAGLNDSHGVVKQVGSLGLILVLAGVGFEFRCGQSRKASRRSFAQLVDVLGPFAIAAALVWPAVPAMTSEQPSLVTLFFVTLALGITAVPVLAAIVEDLPLRWSSVGERALRTAVLTDAAVWTSLLALGTVLSTTTDTSALDALTGAALISATVVGGRLLGRGVTRGSLVLTTVVLCSIAGALGADLLGAHYSLGAVVSGLAVRPAPAVRHAFAQLKPFVYVILLPIFLVSAAAHAPLQRVGDGGASLVALVWCLLAALIAKVLPAVISSAMRRASRSEAIMYAALLNCRGVTELVVAAIGLEMGLINAAGFAILSVVALTSTLLTSPVIGLVDRSCCRRAPQTRPEIDAAIASPSVAGSSVP